jgi:hypothetical protein
MQTIAFASVIHETKLAYLFCVDGDNEPQEVWMPKSMVFNKTDKTFDTYESFSKVKKLTPLGAQQLIKLLREVLNAH